MGTGIWTNQGRTTRSLRKEKACNGLPDRLVGIGSGKLRHRLSSCCYNTGGLSFLERKPDNAE